MKKINKCLNWTKVGLKSKMVKKLNVLCPGLNWTKVGLK